MPRPRTPRAFTLIELLVVLSIIALLIAILLPALSQARDAARSVACLSNQRQLGITFAAYLSENDDCYPPSFWGETAPGWSYSWPQILAPYVGLDFGRGQNNYAPIPPDTIWRCPSMDFQFSTDATNGWYGICYGYNERALGNRNYDPYTNYGVPHPPYPTRSASLKQPSRQMVLVDAEYSDTAPNRGRWVVSFPSWVNYRHGQHANLLYADGHAGPGDYELLEGGSGFALVNRYPWNQFLRN